MRARNEFRRVLNVPGQSAKGWINSCLRLRGLSERRGHMTLEELEIYLAMTRKARVEYYASPETLKKIDQMEVMALDLFNNPPAGKD
ncbi:MAG TPA: hypothetical protein VGO47_08935 [Chlamydiales bacterium]|nr:hypothetical protein [Chlamydiales bacterium]